ncbi:MAG TPA: serine hydrolase [Gemmataceae bacterium]|jgi:CubicO group peptidase (beta-lactamase class C family)|nr:serine hydrolase [Gemmataceae bacterium]
MNRTLLSLLCIVVVSPFARADNAAVADDPKAIAEKCAAYMDARMKISKFSGSLIVARNGEPLFEGGYGLANVEHNVPNTPKTKFRLASVSKQFVATGIMILEHEGKLKVEDTLQKHLSDCPKAWADVTIHQLLSHTSGVPENLRPALFQGKWPVPVSTSHVYDVVKDKPLDFKPGEKWSYSNTGYDLLGLIIEKITGKSYGDFLKERIFDPLHMYDTGVDSRPLVLKNRAYNYGLQRGEYIIAQYIDMSEVYAAGSLYSTVEDLLKWDNALFTEKLLPKKSWERMWTPVKNDYGYGWAISSRFGKKVITHNGGLPGCTTTVERYPESKLFIAVLCNLEGSPMRRVCTDMSAIALGEPYDLPVEHKEIKADPKTFDAYLGEFELKPKLILTISKTGDSLCGQATSQVKFQLYPEAEARFFARIDEIVITFVKDDKGQVNEMIYRQNGRDIKAKRVVKAPEKKEEKKEEKKQDKKEDKKEQKKEEKKQEKDKA